VVGGGVEGGAVAGGAVAGGAVTGGAVAGGAMAGGAVAGGAIAGGGVTPLARAGTFGDDGAVPPEPEVDRVVGAVGLADGVVTDGAVVAVPFGCAAVFGVVVVRVGDGLGVLAPEAVHAPRSRPPATRIGSVCTTRFMVPPNAPGRTSSAEVFHSNLTTGSMAESFTWIEECPDLDTSFGLAEPPTRATGQVAHHCDDRSEPLPDAGGQPPAHCSPILRVAVTRQEESLFGQYPSDVACADEAHDEDVAHRDALQDVAQLQQEVGRVDRMANQRVRTAPSQTSVCRCEAEGSTKREE